MTDLKNLFSPRTVAVIGASNDKNKVGYSLVFNLKDGGASGSGAIRKIFPVSLTEETILDLPAYKSVLDIHDDIDLAVIAIPAPAVPAVLEECGKKKVPAAIVISSGFKEAGDAGKELEKKLAAIARRRNIALLGPNCLGTIDAYSDLNATFAAASGNAGPVAARGSVAVLSQSGAMGAAMLDWAREEGVGFSKFISLGNEASLTELDFLEYLAKDKDTKAILLYLEKVSDGKKFMALAQKITRTKPIVVLKAGRSARGSAAVLSHTGSLAPEGAVFEAACRECGVVTVGSLREFYNTAKFFQVSARSGDGARAAAQPPREVAILTNGGGPSAVAADLVELSPSLSLAKLSASTKQKLAKVLPPMAALGNPVDILGDALAPRYESALTILCAEKSVQGIILILTPQMMTDAESVARLVTKYGAQKLILPALMGRDAVAKGVAALHENGLVNFDFPDDAIGALAGVALAAFGQKKPEEAVSARAATAATAKKLAGKPTASLMDYQRSTAMLKKYGIKLSGDFVRTKKDLALVFAKLKGRPAAMKIVSKEVSHKTDVGGVRLGIADPAAAERAWDEIAKAVRRKVPGAKIQGILVQPMAQGREIIIGMKRDPVFGPVVSFGLGGIFVEAMKDVALRVAPVSDADARAMMDEIKGASLLHGARGQRPLDLAVLAKLVVALSRLALANPKVQAIDLNPVMANEKGAVVVDARVIVF